MSIFEKINPYIKYLHLEEFNQVKPLRLISDKIGFGCQPSHLILASLILILGSMALSIGSFFLSSIVGFLYPAYMSFKALQSKNVDDDKQWLTYWIVFSFLTCFDGIISSILMFVPMYYFIKLVFYIYLFHPSTKGATMIYSKTIRPLLQKYEGKIDETLKEGQERMTGIYEQAANKLQQQQ